MTCSNALCALFNRHIRHGRTPELPRFVEMVDLQRLVVDYRLRLFIVQLEALVAAFFASAATSKNGEESLD